MGITYNPETTVRRGEKHVLCDADCVAYWGAATCDEMALRTATRRVDQRMNQILDECKAENYTNYLTGKDNFRDGIATLQRYKGNRYDKNGRRISSQPAWLQQCRQHIIDEWDGILVPGQEADDALSIHRNRFPYSNREYIISSIDKDLQINYGDHHNQNTGKIIRVSPGMEPLTVTVKTSAKGSVTSKVTGVGLMFFYAQLLMGDNADWIKGLPKVTEAMKDRWPKLRRGGCGPMAAVRVLDGCTEEEDALDRIWYCYKSFWENNAYQHWASGRVYPCGIVTAKAQLIEQGRLLWMRTKENQLWEPPYELR